MPDRVVQEFPLFPLGLVALPHEFVPLHIFEERYRTMIGECLDRGTEFGIVWTGEDGGRQIGCAMEVARVLERMDDGRLNILTRGTRPFRVIELDETLPYPAATVEFLQDAEEEDDAESASVAHEAYRSLVQQATDNEVDEEDLDAMGVLRDGRDRRVRARGQAGVAGPAIGERAAAPRRTPLPRRDETS